jgi:uncharacterized membrane protein YeaQ/YmgE (transglycosylase-associated protein family)
MLSVFWWIIVGLIAGWATGKIMGGRRGIAMDIILGLAGALVGGEIMRLVGFRGHGGLIYTVLVATGGAVLLTWLYRLVVERRSRGGRGGLQKAA